KSSKCFSWDHCCEMWNPSDDENSKILSQSLKVKAFVNQLSSEDRGRWGGGQFSFEILYPGYRVLNKILSARLEELKKYIQPDIHVIF
ncbi:11155_t:CDS:2, partial [Rhizophagus irregularis]